MMYNNLLMLLPKQQYTHTGFFKKTLNLVITQMTINSKFGYDTLYQSVKWDYKLNSNFGENLILFREYF